MKSIFKTLSLGIVLSTLAAFANAHSSHAHMEPLTKEAIVERANQVVDVLMSKQQLEESWSSAQATEASEQETSRGRVWVVRYANPNASDETKQDLYIFVDEMGNPVTANHDGEL